MSLNTVICYGGGHLEQQQLLSPSVQFYISVELNHKAGRDSDDNVETELLCKPAVVEKEQDRMLNMCLCLD